MHHEQRQARPGYLLLKIAWLKQKSDATFFKKNDHEGTTTLSFVVLSA